MEVFQCWVDNDGKIISFRPLINAQHEKFQSQEALMHYIFDVIDRYHYRVQ